MGDSLKMALEHPGWWLAVTTYPALLNLVTGLLIQWYIQYIHRDGQRSSANRTATVADKHALQRIRRYQIYLPLVALLLSLAAIIVGASLRVFMLLYFAAFGVVVILVIEFFRIRHVSSPGTGSEGVMTGGTAPSQGTGHTAVGCTPRTRPHLRNAAVRSLVILVFLGSAFTVSRVAVSWHRLVKGGDSRALIVFPIFSDLMKVGDIDDVEISKIGEGYRISYTAAGQRPHEWQFKYRNGVESPDPARFGGVICVNDVVPARPGTNVKDGQDLRSYAGKIVVEARSVNGPATVTFVIGGITWAWNEDTKTTVSLPYPDSMPKRDLGTKELTDSWREFEFDLGALGLQPEDFKRVIGGFGWVMTWPSPPQPGHVFTIEVRKARYLR